MMRISKAGFGMMAAYEGIFLYGYADPGPTGLPVTDGLGHTAAAGGRVPKLGQRITFATAIATGREDMRGAEGRVNSRVRLAASNRLTQAQFDALADFEHNTGAIGSGTVDDKLNAGQTDAALAVLGQYVKAKGKTLPGLVTRRREEIELFRTGRYPTRSILIKDAPGSPGRSIPVSSIPWDEPAEPAPVLSPSVLDPIPAPVVPAPVQGNFIADLAAYLWSFWK